MKLCPILALVFAIIGSAFMRQPVAAQAVGDVLPPYTAGGMDIHHINTGEGNATFFILPDGTTLLVDCGDGSDIKRPLLYKAPRHPDESRMPGEWVARYIKKVHPAGEGGAIDYLVLTHCHSDHMGGVADLARLVPIREVLDRGWPDYVKPVAFKGEFAEKYKTLLQNLAASQGTKVSQFKAGVADQIVLRKEPAKYPGFEVRHLAVNGEVWTGQGTEVRQRTASIEAPNENACSTALRLRYGQFDYFTGGDLPGVPGGEVAQSMPLIAARRESAAWRDMESPLAWVTGPVDAMLMNHHAGADTTNAFFLSVLQPRVALVHVWACRQLDPGVLHRMRSENIYPGPRDIFTTNGMWQGRKEHLIPLYGEEPALRHIADLEGIAATQGHIVIRVAPGGGTYMIYVLDDSQESYRIRSVHGKYESR